MGSLTSITPYADTPEAQQVLSQFLDWADGQTPLAGLKILEIGSGAGHSTVAVLDRMGKDGYIFAIEPDDDYRLEAQKRIENLQYHDRVAYLDVRAQDVATNPLLAKSGIKFDLFIWANGIHYLEDPREMAQFFVDMKKLCRFGGYFCTAFSAEAASRETMRLMGYMTRFALAGLGIAKEDAPAPKRLHAYTGGDYTRLTAEAGFECEIARVVVPLSASVYQGIAYDETWLSNALPAEGALAKFSKEERIAALVAGTAQAYEQLDITTADRVWLFGRVF